jgi:predicted CoA-substrate-specific enzyme activase
VTLNVYLGIDVGSISTCLAALTESGDVVATGYLRTRGNPQGAVVEGLTEIKHRTGDDLCVLGVATTGSARRLVGALVGADLVKNEIIAHAMAAMHYYDDVRTVLEIGGQDSKIILIRDNVVVDFAMNTVCAAGTGSFLDQQALRLGIPIEEFGGYARQAKHTVKIASKCTVFAESDMVHKAQLGVAREDIIAGLCEGIVRNYLSNVAKGKRIEDRVVFQGGVANNCGVVDAFRNELGTEITVPEHRAEMGAIGAALLARRHTVRHGLETTFAGFELDLLNFESRVFECDHCPNRCEVIELTRNGVVVDRYNYRCQRWDLPGPAEDLSAAPSPAETEAAHRDGESERTLSSVSSG